MGLLVWPAGKWWKGTRDADSVTWPDEQAIERDNGEEENTSMVSNVSGRETRQLVSSMRQDGTEESGQAGTEPVASGVWSSTVATHILAGLETRSWNWMSGMMD